MMLYTNRVRVETVEYQEPGDFSLKQVTSSGRNPDDRCTVVIPYFILQTTSARGAVIHSAMTAAHAIMALQTMRYDARCEVDKYVCIHIRRRLLEFGRRSKL